MVAQRLIKAHFPGALTVVLDKSSLTPDYMTSGMKTVGIRVPDNAVFAEICKIIPNHVLATTSANISHEPPALTYEEAVDCVGSKVGYIVRDYGYKSQGIAALPRGQFNFIAGPDSQLRCSGRRTRKLNGAAGRRYPAGCT